MKRYAFFDESGRINRLYTGPEQEVHLQHTGKFLEVGEEVIDDTHYVDLHSDFDPIIRGKIPLSAEYIDDGLAVVFPSLPAGTRAEVQGLELISDGEPTIIEFDVPGTYEVQFYPPPQWRDEVLEVTVG